MLRLTAALMLLAFAGERSTAPRGTAAFPHAVYVTSPMGRPVAFRAYSRGGLLVITVDDAGRYVKTTNDRIPRIKRLSEGDTVRSETPAEFMLDLSNGPVEFVADGKDSLHVKVGKNPYGSVDQAWADGHKLSLRLSSAGVFVIDGK